MKIGIKNRIDPSFSMVSMADLVFLLLIFLLITKNYHTKVVPVDLPLSASEKTVQKEVSVVITARLHYYVEGKRVVLGQLQDTLALQLAKIPNKVVVLHMDKRLSIAHMVVVADIAHKLGATVSIATELKKK